MSNREKIAELLKIIPDYKIGYVLAYVQGLAADEEADDIFCQKLFENYENAPDEDKEDIPLEDCLKNGILNMHKRGSRNLFFIF